MQDSKYLVFRIYSEKERSDKSAQSIYYGWSTHKSVIKAFFQQRSHKKYKAIKVSNDEIRNYHSDDFSDWEDRSYMIDFIKLKSVKSGEEYLLFITLKELRETEIDIQGLFQDLASVSTIDGDAKYIDMVYNLQEEYFDALYFLGYRPPEIKALFSDDIESLYTDPEVEEQINNAYDDAERLPPEDFSMRSRSMLPGQYFMVDIANKILYSIESFMKVMKDNM